MSDSDSRSGPGSDRSDRPGLPYSLPSLENLRVGQMDRVLEPVARRMRRNLDRANRGVQLLGSELPEMASTPKELVHQRGTLSLYRYVPQSDEVYRKPLLLVMSLINKPYIFDLAPGQSLVEYLLREGFDVYMIDWGTPRPEDYRLKLEDYVLRFLPECIERVQHDSGVEDISLVGYCMGGLLATLYAALHAEDPVGPVRNLACFTTPVNYEGMGHFAKWSDADMVDPDRLVEAYGNVPPEMLYAAFSMLRPVSNAVGRLRLLDNLDNDEYVANYRRFDHWANDQIPFPGACYKQTMVELQQRNRLVRGRLRLDGRRVDLGDIHIPVLHIVAEHDHIVPYPSAKDLVPLVGSDDKQEVMLKGGHVSLVAGPRAKKRMWPALSGWLAPRSE